MKRVILIVLMSSCILVSAVVIINYIDKDLYIKNMMSRYTEIDNYQIEVRQHDNYQWYFKVLISEKDGNKLFKLHPFTQGFQSINLKGKSLCNFISQDNNHWYWLDDNIHGHYAYALLCLSQDKRHFEIYHLFGD